MVEEVSLSKSVVSEVTQRSVLRVYSIVYINEAETSRIFVASYR